MNDFTHYMEQEKDRQGRIERAGAALLSGEKERLGEIQQETALALARVYSGNLTEDVTARLIASMVLDADVLCAVSGGLSTMPSTREGWNIHAKELVKTDPLAQRCLDFADAKLKEGFRQEALARLDGTTKMTMARANTLDAYLEGEVKSRLDDRARG